MLNDVPLTLRTEGVKTIVDVEVENLDFRNAELMKAKIGEIVKGGQKHIILNLRKVNFMDSSGLSILLSGKRLTEEAGGSFGICELQVYVNNLINLTNLNKTIAVFASDADAAK
jgi:anti-sigma B factor antagonist